MIGVTVNGNLLSTAHFFCHDEPAEVSGQKKQIAFLLSLRLPFVKLRVTKGFRRLMHTFLRAYIIRTLLYFFCHTEPAEV
jgi:hypothetical protein